MDKTILCHLFLSLYAVVPLDLKLGQHLQYLRMASGQMGCRREWLVGTRVGPRREILPSEEEDTFHI